MIVNTEKWTVGSAICGLIAILLAATGSSLQVVVAVSAHGIILGIGAIAYAITKK